ncbi:MAG: Ku protein [Verrucomicrobiota bacterium]|nr:Ku protein [Verrucomicrobiota bacterium]
MRAIWKGAISFGLVNIPVALYTATRRDDISFRQLRKSDLSPINYKRVAEVDGQEVPWEQIVKGYEHEKGQLVVMSDADLEKAQAEATQTVEITDFVSLDQIDPIFFDKPYFLEPQKGGKKAYALLRDVLKETNKVGIARVVLKTKQHLAAVKPSGDLLVLELMHFSEELIEPSGLDLPREETLGKKELEMAKQLVQTMTGKWEPEKYKDETRAQLMKVIEEKIAAGDKPIKGQPGKPRPATNVVDLVAVLQKSLEENAKKKPQHPRKQKKAA